MGRPERPLDGSGGPVAAFAHDLRVLRNKAGNPSYRELARTALFAPSVLSSAASGYRLPTLPVTLGFVAACGGDRDGWEKRWRQVAALVEAGESRADRPADRAATGPGSGPGAGNRAEPAGAPPRSFDLSGAPPRSFDLSGAPPRSFELSVASLARPAELPLGASTFVGRKPMLAGASRLIGQPGPVKAPIMVSGPIGVGKTAFALCLADRVVAEFPDGQLYADLSLYPAGGRATDGQPADSVVGGFLRAMGVPAPLIPAEEAQRVGLYRSLLAERRLFVLLENPRDECQVRTLLGRTSTSQVVVTSRDRLLGLEGTHRIDLEPFARHESMALLGRLAGAGRVQAEYAAADTVAEMCGDLPLAVNVIGRRIAVRPEWTMKYVVGLLVNHERRMENLCVGDVSIREQLSAAFRQLPAAGRRALRRLGAAGAGWTSAVGLAAAMDVPVLDADQLLETLVDAGLLTRTDVAGRYCVSAVVGAFASTLAAEPAPVVPAPMGVRAQRTALDLRHAGRQAGRSGTGSRH